MVLGHFFWASGAVMGFGILSEVTKVWEASGVQPSTADFVPRAAKWRWARCFFPLASQDYTRTLA